MAKKLSEMSLEKQERARALARQRQQRRRARLAGDPAYKAQCRLYNERWARRKQGLTVDEENSSDQHEEEEPEESSAGPSEQRHLKSLRRRRTRAQQGDSDEEEGQLWTPSRRRLQCRSPQDDGGEDEEVPARKRRRLAVVEMDDEDNFEAVSDGGGVEMEVEQGRTSNKEAVEEGVEAPQEEVEGIEEGVEAVEEGVKPPQEAVEAVKEGVEAVEEGVEPLHGAVEERVRQEDEGMGGSSRNPPKLRRLAPISSRAETNGESESRQPMDFVTGVLGIQVDARAETVVWTSGQRTVLPYLPRKTPRRKLVKNALEIDAKYARHLAGLPECKPGSELVEFLDKNARGLLRPALEALSRNKSVVVRGYIDTHGFDFTLEGLEDELSISPNRPIEAHDMGHRATTSFNKPHVLTTVKEFVGDIENTKVTRVSLGFPLPQYTAPWPFEKLDDGLSLGWAQTQVRIPIEGTDVPADSWTTRSWGLGHHAGIMTYPHHDAAGAGTFAVALSGLKNWVVMRVKEGAATRDSMEGLLQELNHPKIDPTKYLNRVEMETVHLYPGDLLIMPPGQLHTVYTPVAGFSRGGHFFNLDTMHLTEMSRFLDATSGSFFTNDYHHGTLETLCRLVISLTILPESRKLYKRSLIALCGMVLYHNTYTQQGWDTQGSQTFDTASEIAKEILDYFELTDLGKYQAFISEGDVFDRGEEAHVHWLLHAKA